MKVFVYEAITATMPAQDSSLYREGLAMRVALTADLAAIDGVEVVSFRDGDSFEQRLAGCDAVWLIAPELGDSLGQLADRVVAAQKPLLGPSPVGIRTTSDKLGLARQWQRRGVPTPVTVPASQWRTLPTPFPIVFKPIDGCGSTATVRVQRQDEAGPVFQNLQAEGFSPEGMIAQQFVDGTAASVSFLVGNGHAVPLLPAVQHVDPDRQFVYEGGTIPLAEDLAERAVRLATRAIHAVDGLQGYVGVDLILGPADDGSDDRALEINPRLTTSYVGLRALAAFNLAEAVLDLCLRNVLPLPRWKRGRVRFSTDGLVTWL